jgi:hypothetical protein
MTTKPPPWPMMIGPGVTLVSIDDVPAQARAHVPVSSLPGLSLRIGEYLSLPPSAPPEALAAALQLSPSPYAPPSLLHGATVLRAIQDTVESKAPDKQRLAELRRLAAWAPSAFYRSVSVVAFLDAQTEPTRGGFFRWQSSKGRHAVHDRLLGMLLAVEAIVRAQTKPNVSAACERVANCRALEAGIGAEHLENMFAKYGKLVTAIAAGYAIPALYLTEYQWPMRADDEMTLY